MKTEKSKIFFSYARADAEFTLKLAKSLRSAGANLWIDQLDIPGGADWDDAVEQALKLAQSVLVILSPAAVESTNVMNEVSFALQQGKRVVPVLYKTCEIPLRLHRKQHIDFTAEFDLGLEKLLHDFNIKPTPGEPKLSEVIAPEPPRLQIKIPRQSAETARKHNPSVKRTEERSELQENLPEENRSQFRRICAGLLKTTGIGGALAVGGYGLLQLGTALIAGASAAAAAPLALIPIGAVFGGYLLVLLSKVIGGVEK